MSIKELNVFTVEFPNLKELLKIYSDHRYILKYGIDESFSYYYSVMDSENLTFVVFCVDKNFAEEHVKNVNGTIVGTNEPGGKTLTLATVAHDLFFESVIKKFGLNKE